jgi:hypothetical protein
MCAPPSSPLPCASWRWDNYLEQIPPIYTHQVPIQYLFLNENFENEKLISSNFNSHYITKEGYIKLNITIYCSILNGEDHLWKSLSTNTIYFYFLFLKFCDVFSSSDNP